MGTTRHTHGTPGRVVDRIHGARDSSGRRALVSGDPAGIESEAGRRRDPAGIESEADPAGLSQRRSGGH